jgi:hypothetical protein
MALGTICLETSLSWRRLAVDLATLVWSLGGIYLIKGDVCATGAGTALAGMDGIIVLCAFVVPSFLIARKRGVPSLKAAGGGRPVWNGDVLPAVTVIMCAVGLVLSIAVIVDQAHYLCFRH